MDFNALRFDFMYCWFHDSYHHHAHECKELWQMNGIQATIWAKLRRRCVICGQKEHFKCPYQTKLRCAVEGCGQNHTTLNCMKRKAKVFKDDSINAKQAKILESLSSERIPIAESNLEREKLSISDKEKDLISFEEPHMEINRDHLSENDHQNLNTPYYAFTVSIEQIDSEIEGEEADSNKSLSKSKLTVTDNGMMIPSGPNVKRDDPHKSEAPKKSKKHFECHLNHTKLKSKYGAVNQFQVSECKMAEKNDSEKHAGISKKLSKFIKSDKSKGSKNFQTSKKRQQQCHTSFSESCSKLKFMHIKKKEAKALKLSLNVLVLLRRLRRYQEIQKLRHWKFKPRILRIFCVKLS